MKDRGAIFRQISYQIRFQPPYVCQSLGILLQILNQDRDHHRMLRVLARKESSLVKVPALPAHGYRSVQVELVVARRFNEVLELLNVFCLGVAIQEQNGVVGVGFLGFVELFEVVN